MPRRSHEASARVWLAPCVQMCEMAFVAPQVVAYRTSRMVAGGWPPTARERREYTRMVTEKVEAVGQVAGAMVAFSAGAGPTPLITTIDSLHRKVMANHRRLSGR